MIKSSSNLNITLNNILKNNREHLLSTELKKSLKSVKNEGTAFIFTVESIEQIKKLNLFEKNNAKFVFTEDKKLRIGLITKGNHKKTLSHPSINNIIDGKETNIISAGYIKIKGKNIFITNKSGHYRPSFKSLKPVKKYINNLIEEGNNKSLRVKRINKNSILNRVIF